ncbi:dihydrolipoamide acetyltransferase family protein [Zhihengliuella sp.]|uniref:dihydrolipoamide acetyltransferase family protein n=1 Tax=Zhihengliuella sp. TaxID=1954483 RepID=UPI00281234F2|nr:dihydrolipoamide acetyltransferase family protein [Zhihengliuella sp.]
MLRIFNLPDLGEGLTESEIVAWKVAEGDRVRLNQIIADVETAKAVVELPSPYDGVVKEIFAPPGTVVEVGKPMIAFETGDAVSPAAPDSSSGADPSAAGDEPAPPRREPNLVGYGATVESGRPVRRRRAAASGGRALADLPAGEAASASVAVKERPRSTPPVRKLARDLGVDLETLIGTGPEGLITRHDVESAADGGPENGADPAAVSPGSAPTGRAQPADESRSASPGEERLRVGGVQRLMADAMVRSAFTAPHATEFLTLDVTASVELLERLRARKDFEDVKLTPFTLVAKAVCVALRRSPELNSRWDGETGEIVRYAHVNLGFAAATERGLMVPNVKHAEALDLHGLAAELGRLTRAAREGKASPSDLSGGTFSITNIGVFGIDAGTPIINPPEAGILAVGQIRRQPWEHRGGIELRDVVTLSLSFDHRLADGAQASRFLAEVGSIMADPATLITLV